GERSYLTARMMVGRKREAERLSVALSSVAAPEVLDDCRPLLLAGGEAGIGKSRLISEFRRDAALAGIEPVHVQGPEAPCAPVHPSTVGIRELSATGDVPARESESTAAGGARAEAPDDRASRERSRVLDLYTDFLLERVGASPLLIVLEDIHWADGA